MFSPKKTRRILVPVFLGLALGQQIFAAGASVPASSRKSCEDLKLEIDAKLKSKGVKTFTLEIIAKADVKDAKVVGSCEAGTKKITYKKG